MSDSGFINRINHFKNIGVTTKGTRVRTLYSSLDQSFSLQKTLRNMRGSLSSVIKQNAHMCQELLDDFLFGRQRVVYSKTPMCPFYS